MAKVHGKNFNLYFNSVDIGVASNSASLSISADTAEVTTASDVAKAYVEGDYGATWSASGPADFGTGLTDATLFAAFGSGPLAIYVNPNTATTATTNPKYSQNAILTGYTLNFGIGDAVTFSADWQGTGAVTRTTS